MRNPAGQCSVMVNPLVPSWAKPAAMQVVPVQATPPIDPAPLGSVWNFHRESAVFWKMIGGALPTAMQKDVVQSMSFQDRAPLEFPTAWCVHVCPSVVPRTGCWLAWPTTSQLVSDQQEAPL